MCVCLRETYLLKISQVASYVLFRDFLLCYEPHNSISSFLLLLFHLFYKSTQWLAADFFDSAIVAFQSFDCPFFSQAGMLPNLHGEMKPLHKTP